MSSVSHSHRAQMYNVHVNSHVEELLEADMQNGHTMIHLHAGRRPRESVQTNWQVRSSSKMAGNEA